MPITQRGSIVASSNVAHALRSPRSARVRAHRWGEKIKIISEKANSVPICGVGEADDERRGARGREAAFRPAGNF